MHITTTADLPVDVRAEFEMTEDLAGGPAFSFPHHGTIDFSKLSLISARALVAGRFKYLRAKTPANNEAPTPLPEKRLEKAKA